MDEDLKKLIENSATDMRNHFDAVSERLERTLGVVAEGVVTNGERADRLERVMKEEFAEVGR